MYNNKVLKGSALSQLTVLERYELVPAALLAWVTCQTSFEPLKKEQRVATYREFYFPSGIPPISLILNFTLPVWVATSFAGSRSTGNPMLPLKSSVSVGYTSQPPSIPKVTPHGASLIPNCAQDAPCFASSDMFILYVSDWCWRRWWKRGGEERKRGDAYMQRSGRVYVACCWHHRSRRLHTVHCCYAILIIINNNTHNKTQHHIIIHYI